MWGPLVLVVSNRLVAFVARVFERLAPPAVEIVGLAFDGLRVCFLGIHARHVPMM